MGTCGQPLVGIVIRCRNAEAHLAVLSSELCLQQDVDFRVVIVDNASSDGSAEVAIAAGWSVVPMAVDDWSWGKAINVGIRALPDEVRYVLVWSADVSPAGRTVVRDLVAVLEDRPEVAAVYARQIPRSDAPLLEVGRLRAQFGESSGTIRRADLEGAVLRQTLAVRGMAISNACGMYRRACLTEFLFDEEIAGEELPWCESVIAAGWGIRYAADVAVFHSHREPLRREILRTCDLEYNRAIGRRPVLRSSLSLGLLVVRQPLKCTRVALGVKGVSAGRRLIGVMRAVPVGLGCALVALLVSCGVPFSGIKSRYWS